MSVLNNFLQNNKTVTIQHGNRSMDIAKTLQKTLIGVMTGVILLGALPSPDVQAASFNTIQTYTVANELHDTIEQTIQKHDGDNRAALKELRESKEFETKKIDFSQKFLDSFDSIVKNLKKENLLDDRLGISLDVQVTNELKKDASTDHLVGFADVKASAIELNFNLLSNQTTIKNANFKLSKDEMKVSNEDMFEFLTFHEIGHLQQEQVGNFKSIKLTDEENQKINFAFEKSERYINSNYSSLSKDGKQLSYISGLREIYADTYATLSYLKVNNFSDKAIKDIEFIRDIRADNSYRDLQEAKAKGLSNDAAFIDAYPTHQAMTFILENLNKIKNTPNQDIRYLSQEISSNFMYQAVMSNKGKNFQDKAVAKVNGEIQSIVENTTLKVDLGLEDAKLANVASLSKDMVLQNMKDLRLKVEQPVFNSNNNKPK